MAHIIHVVCHFAAAVSLAAATRPYPRTERAADGNQAMLVATDAFEVHPIGFGNYDVPIDTANVASMKELQRDAMDAVLPGHGEESLRWLNALFARMWPKVDEAAQKIVREKVAPKIKESLPEMLGGHVQFKKFTLGATPPRLGPISFYDAPGGLKLKVGITFNSSSEIGIEVLGMLAAVRSLFFKGTLVVRFAPLIGEVPVIGGIVLYFLDPPLLELELGGLAQAAKVLGLEGIVYRALNDAVAGALLLPNVISIPLGTEEQGVDSALLSLPMPRGVLRVTALQRGKPIADNARSSSVNQGMSDPYLLIHLAGDSWRSRAVETKAKPSWKPDNWHEFVVFDHDQNINIKVINEDHVRARAEVKAGGLTMNVSDALEKQQNWIPLHHQRNGHKVLATKETSRVLLGFEWLDAISDLDCGSAVNACLAAVSIKQLKVPPELGDEFSITVSADGNERSLPLVQAGPPDADARAEAEAAAAVDKTLSHVVQLSRENGLGTTIISEITGLSIDEVEKILSRSSESFKAPGPTMVNFQKVVYLPLHTSAFEAGSLTITVNDKQNVAVASGSWTLSKVRKLSQVRKKSYWPLTLACVGEEVATKEASVSVGVSLQALKQASRGMSSSMK